MTRVVSVEEAKQDVKTLTDEELMIRYQVSKRGLRCFFDRLMRAWADGGSRLYLELEDEPLP